MRATAAAILVTAVVSLGPECSTWGAPPGPSGPPTALSAPVSPRRSSTARWAASGSCRWLVGGPRQGAAYAVHPACIRVYDGDTFYVGTETIRLRGVDTPEVGRRWSALATGRLAALLRSGWVTIVPRAVDIYGRTVADVYVQGWSVAEVLRREGFDTRRPRSRSRVLR